MRLHLGCLCVQGAAPWTVPSLSKAVTFYQNRIASLCTDCEVCGQVFKCRDHKTGEMCALKVIRNQKRFHKQALVEIKILEHLRNQVTLLHTGFLFCFCMRCAVQVACYPSQHAAPLSCCSFVMLGIQKQSAAPCMLF